MIEFKKYYPEIFKLKNENRSSMQIAQSLISNFDDFKDKEASSLSRYLRFLFDGSRGKYLEFENINKGLSNTSVAKSNKKEKGEVGWRELGNLIKKHQDIKNELSTSQKYLTWEAPNGDSPIVVMVVGDTQLGSFGTDYDLFEKLTDEIVNTPNLYVLLVGDILQLAIKMRGLAEVLDNAINPSMQYEWLESWVNEIKHKIIAATWCNHGATREENVMGFSLSGKIYGKHVPYFSGIGEIEMKVGKQTYMVAASHFFRGKSMYNKAHAPMRYMREKANHIEIAVQGDFHEPSILQQEYGGLWRTAIVCGSLQTNSSYANRFFSLRTLPNMPCFTLDRKEHIINAYSTLGHYLNK